MPATSSKPRHHAAATGIEGAIPGQLPTSQAPQLASVAEDPPADDAEWLCEVKFDGYRLFAFKDGKAVRLLTCNGLDWTERLPGITACLRRLAVDALLLDCELVAFGPDGLSSFAALQTALSAGEDGDLVLFAFDVLHLNGLDLRGCRLDVRKSVMETLDIWNAKLRFSEHIQGDAGQARRQACAMGLEGIIAKRTDSVYRAGRGTDWMKLECTGREAFVVLGWTPPNRSRVGIGGLELGFYDKAGALHHAGRVSSGFTDGDMRALRVRLDGMEDETPPLLAMPGATLDRGIVWVQPALVVEVQFVGWSEDWRLRHAVYLGLREDKPAQEVVHPGPALETTPKRRAIAPAPSTLTHPDKQLWPGVTKQDLANYWDLVADVALPGIAGRPLALVRCPDGIAGPHFFQKHAMKGMNPALREAEQGGAPYLVFDDAAGLRACVQMAAIELHSWGASAADAAHADRLVFDLDPGDGVAWEAVVGAAVLVRDKLGREGLTGFCRTSGGKGLHVVAPLTPGAEWDGVLAWSRWFAERLEKEFPDRFVASVPKAKRVGRILIDWLRNGLGSTAVASFSPRARTGATVATPLVWREVTPKLDPGAFTLATVPKRLARQKRDPWEGFVAAARPLPGSMGTPPARR